jgi:hypothetical protein
MITSSRLWYARLRLLTDGHGQVSEGWFAYNRNTCGHAEDQAVRAGHGKKHHRRCISPYHQRQSGR